MYINALENESNDVLIFGRKQDKFQTKCSTEKFFKFHFIGENTWPAWETGRLLDKYMNAH